MLPRSQIRWLLVSYGTEGDMHAPLFANQVVQVRRTERWTYRGAVALVGELHRDAFLAMAAACPWVAELNGPSCSPQVDRLGYNTLASLMPSIARAVDMIGGGSLRSRCCPVLVHFRTVGACAAGGCLDTGYSIIPQAHAAVCCPAADFTRRLLPTLPIHTGPKGDWLLSCDIHNHYRNGQLAIFSVV